MVLLGSKQGGTLKLVNPKHKDWTSIKLLTLLVSFTLPRCQVILQWKQTKEKLGNALSAWTCIWLGTFRYNSTRGQFNNEGEGELYEIKRSSDKRK